jgi:uncharacterized protein YqgV (UPF0045/DUF77 family)
MAVSAPAGRAGSWAAELSLFVPAAVLALMAGRAAPPAPAAAATAARRPACCASAPTRTRRPRRRPRRGPRRRGRRARARELGAELRFAPAAGPCDVVMGVAAADGPLLATRPYHHSLALARDVAMECAPATPRSTECWTPRSPGAGPKWTASSPRTAVGASRGREAGAAARRCAPAGIFPPFVRRTRPRRHPRHPGYPHMLFNFSLWPLAAGDRTAEAVAGVVDIIDRSGLPYQLTAMATLLEGEWHEVLPLVTECELRTREKYGRTYCVLMVDSDARGPAAS